MAEKRSKTSRSSGAKAPAKTTRPRAASKPAAKKKLASKKLASKKVASKKTAGRTAVAPAKKATRKTASVGVAKVVVSSPLHVVEKALDDLKAVNVRVLDVRKLTDVADTMIIASGNSDRHVRSIADRVVTDAKKAGYRPVGVEGERDGEWVLVDLQDVIVHIMLPRIRELYRLENLWDVSAARREAAERNA
jgi:ribosome-associated protein